jgi:hypothetical protein
MECGFLSHKVYFIPRILLGLCKTSYGTFILSAMSPTMKVKWLQRWNQSATLRETLKFPKPGFNDSMFPKWLYKGTWWAQVCFQSECYFKILWLSSFATIINLWFFEFNVAIGRWDSQIAWCNDSRHGGKYQLFSWWPRPHSLHF